MFDRYGHPSFTYDGPGEIISVSGGDYVGFELYYVGDTSYPLQKVGLGSLTYFLPTGCRIPGGTQPFQLLGHCASNDPVTGQCCTSFGGGEVDGTFPYPDATPTVKIQLLNPPVGTANVQIDWEFPPAAGGGQGVRVESDNGYISSAVSGTSLETFTPGDHWIRGWCCGGVIANTYPFKVPASNPPPQAYVVKAYAETDANPTIERMPTTSASTITVPLGARFRVGIEKAPPGGTTTPISSTYQLSGQSPQQPVIQPPAAFAGLRLFTPYVVFAYQASVAEEAKLFQAVHLGTAHLHIQPSDTNAHAVDLTVNVIRPASLGNSAACSYGSWSDTCVDLPITDAADLTGIPPQYLKGQAEQESRTGTIQQSDDQSFVYEPCRDFERAISLQQFPYNSFTAPDPRGSLLANEDLSPRQKYLIQATSQGTTITRNIVATDRNVTIANIFKSNDCTSHRGGRCHGANWSYTCPGVSRQITANNYAASQIVAQTPIFSSYGRLQIMYTSAEDRTLGWFVEDPANPTVFLYNPSLLFDTGRLFYSGAGSLTVGGFEDTTNWLNELENHGDPTGYNVFADFQEELSAMFHDYNRAWHSQQGSTPYYSSYQAAIFARSARFMPVRSGAILGSH